jgi:pimeloyl-ACP methyl ester carboxylesterase
MPWVDVHGIDIHYLDEGRGQTIVFLHGMSSCAEAWFQQFDAFRDRFRLIAYDSVNHGLSSNSPRDEEEPDRTDELQGFLEALGIERPVIAGNSMGANTLLRWAVRHPDAAAALIPSGSGVSDAPVAPPSTPAIDRETLILPIGDAFTDGFKERERRLYERYLRMRSTATRIEALRYPRPRNRSWADRASLAGRAGGIRSPMLIVVGGLDRAVPACAPTRAGAPLGVRGDRGRAAQRLLRGRGRVQPDRRRIP